MVRIVKANKGGPIRLENRGYKSAADRKRARRLLLRSGATTAMEYRDTQAEFALHVCWPR